MKVFISHAAVDADLAQLIERQLRLADPSLDVFRTSKVGQIPAGKEWLAFIQDNLRSATAFLVVLTPWSMARPWINFETGAAWYSGEALVPVTAGGLDKADVIEPLKSLQLLSLEQPAEAAQAFKELGVTLHDPNAFASAVISLSAAAQSAALAADDWEGVEFGDRYYAWEGPIEDLREGQPKPVPDGLTARLQQEGLRLTHGIHGDLSNEFSKGYSIVWLIDLKHRRRHFLLGPHNQCLLARPTSVKDG